MRAAGPWRALALALAVVAVWGCAAARPRPRRRRPVVRPVPVEDILRAARSQMGRSYAYGGHDPHTGFDCSGLVYWCYRRYGSAMPRTVREQSRVGVAVARDDLRAGDLVFFATASGRRQPSHVGIMVNRGWFIHAPASGQTVRLDQLRNNYWKRTYDGARRVQ